LLVDNLELQLQGKPRTKRILEALNLECRAGIGLAEIAVRETETKVTELVHGSLTASVHDVEQVKPDFELHALG
jgi:hypothetical protein